MRPGGPGRPGGLTVYQAVQTVLGYVGTPNSNTIEEQIGFANREHPQIVDEYGFSGELNANLGWGDLTSITAYRYWKLAGGSDADYTAADILWTDPDVGYQNFKTFTQEFRLTGSNDWVDWLVGAFYANETLDRETSTLNGTDTEAFFSRYRINPGSSTFTRTVLGGVLAQRPLALPTPAATPTHSARVCMTNTIRPRTASRSSRIIRSR